MGGAESQVKNVMAAVSDGLVGAVNKSGYNTAPAKVAAGSDEAKVVHEYNRT